MKYILIFLLTFLIGCENNTPPFPVKEHNNLKKELVENYNAHRLMMQSVASKVSKFKVIRAINFMNNNGTGYNIQVYCDSLNRNSEGKTFNIKDLNDPQLVLVLKEEGITLQELQALKGELDQFNCNSFFTFQARNIETGEDYIHIEFRYNTWNGVNFYYYKLFDKKLDPSMIAFFKSNLVDMNEGVWKGKGDIIDSNAIWYYYND